MNLSPPPGVFFVPPPPGVMTLPGVAITVVLPGETAAEDLEFLDGVLRAIEPSLARFPREEDKLQ
jgi:hypothetical protein